MCCFSVASPSLLGRLFGAQPRVDVAGTRIFARHDGDLQVLAYAMSLTTPSAVAMILPLPVGGDRAVHFVDLSAHADLFDRLQRLFPAPQFLSFDAPRSQKGPALGVFQVGAFEASFVPTAADFERLDPRFRLPDGFLDALPGYRDHGFAVFRINPAKNLPIHPMAFRFRTRDPRRLFFPTVHVHDGKVHPNAGFDHVLYWQGSPPGPDDELAERTVREEFPVVPEVLHPDAAVVSRTLVGSLPNTDTWI